MQSPYRADSESISHGTHRPVKLYRYRACRRLFWTLRIYKDPPQKDQSLHLYIVWMVIFDIVPVPGFDHKMVSPWLVQAT
jgi:hypothetical protein